MNKQNKDTYLKCLGSVIRKNRLERGMTQEQLAISSGYVGETARSTMSKIELGKVDLPISKIHDIAKALDMSTWGLINEYEVSSDGRTIDTVCGYMAPTIIEADKAERSKK